jgi:hypothetical protein
MNRLLLIIVALLCVPAVTEPIQACQCKEYDTPVCALFWRSDAVFVGQVIDIRPLKKKPDNVYTYAMVRFKVQESFRGVSGPIVGVGVATNTLCEPKFKKGKRYLAYASLDDKTNQLFTGMCRGTTLAVDDEYLNELRKLAQREAEESISGRVLTRRYEGVPGIQVEVRSNDKAFKTTTTKYGAFSISLPGPGTFKVRVAVPYAVRLMDYSYDVDVRSTQTESVSIFEYDVALEKSECSYLELDVDGTDPRATAVVAGNVLTATGQAVDKGAVSLINVVDTEPDYIALLKKDGTFRFEKVAPGEYYLVLNARNEVPTHVDPPYARTYYPATTDAREAKKIQVVEGAVIENLSMRVGPPMTERKVAGTVTWKNGRRLEGAYLAVYSGDEYVRRVEIEDDGTFAFILYGDFAYSVEARDFIDEIVGRSQRVQIPRGDSAAHKLVIQRIK